MGAWTEPNNHYKRNSCMTTTISKRVANGLMTTLLSAGLALSMTTAKAYGASDTRVPKHLSCQRIIDNTSSEQNTSQDANQWYSVNDNVMGGKSIGTFTEENDHLRFHGNINTNGGGFASIRRDIDASEFQGTDRIRLAIQSDGRAYNVTLQDENNQQQSTSHRAPLSASSNDDYEIVEILFKDLAAFFRGQRIQTAPFDTASAKTIGIILSDSKDGSFNLNLRWIEVCRKI